MPERPKRRKNKNKRKNKNNRADVNKTNDEVVEKESEESCSTHIDIDETLPKTTECDDSLRLAVDNSVNVNIVAENEPIPEIVGGEILCTNEDVNNNNSTLAVETLQVPTVHFNNIENEIIQIQCETYIVESPEQTLKSKSKLNSTVKSKSLDDDDAPKIIDITEDADNRPDEECVAIVDTSNVLVSDVESDIEWEKAGDLQDITISLLNDVAIGTSVTTVPLNVAQCQQIHISMTPDVETSLRNYLQTLDLSTHPENMNSVEIKAEIEQIINREIRHRLRKKGFADDLGLQRLGPPRTLDVIDEEGSSESSKSSRRQSYLSDKKSDNEDLEDDVFEDKSKTQERMARKTETSFHKKIFGRLVPQQCMLVGAKIKDPEVTEARGDWTIQTVEKMTGAEVVYLTDSSSSTSSIHEYGDETDDGMDTDVSVRMITPTIEVTDTEHLLKNTFISDTESTLLDATKIENDERAIKVSYEKDKDKLEQNKECIQNSHEIIVLSTDNLQTNLYVKDVEPPLMNNENSLNDKEQKENEDKYDLEIKVLKCELNDAINNLIKEVSDTELNENSNDAFVRQDSSSSVSSSQCTAKYNPTSSSMNDISNIVHDNILETNQSNTENSIQASASSHVKDVFDHISGNTTVSKNTDVATNKPSDLRDLCVKRIASFPYGDKILEELASVSERLQNITKGYTKNTPPDKDFTKPERSITHDMPYYPLPDVSPIEKVILPVKFKEPVPPPIQPRHSSLKKKSREEEVWTAVPTKTEPVYICLSPSQKMLMEKTQTTISEETASDLAEIHKKYVDRRGYNEQYTKNNQKDHTGKDVSPVVPFKSQTGSRLLALIRDPAVTNNINTLKKQSRSDQYENKYLMTNTTSKENSRVENLSIKDTFKPIPPPRPKKMSSSFYESDESSDFTDSSMRSMKTERKFFHFSTGNLNKEIEDDISSIQNMHRYYTNTRDSMSDCPRRPSLPKDLCDQQMEYIRQKEKEVEAEIQRLESLPSKAPSFQKTGPRAPLITDREIVDERVKNSNNCFISKRRDFFASLSAPEKRDKTDLNIDHKIEKPKLSKLFSSSQEELQREKMYSEYITQMAQREERKQHKVIKITNTPSVPNSKISKSMPSIELLDSKVNNRIEKEFISKARERWDKLGIKDPETEDERDIGENVYKEPKVIEHKIKVIEGGQERDVRNLPNHLQEFVRFTAKEKKNDYADSSGESESGPASPHVMIWCAVIIIVLAVGKYFLRLLRDK